MSGGWRELAVSGGWRRFGAAAGAMLLLASLLTGCWNSRELSNLAIVVGLGIDVVPDADEYKVSFQVVNPGAITQGSRGGGGGGAIPVTVYSGTARSLFGALRLTSQKLPRQPFFAHIQLLVVGEPVARSGLDELFDFFERSHELRMNTPVLIAREASAEDVLRIVSPLENTPATGIAKRLELTSEVFSINADIHVTDVIRKLAGKGDPIISGVRIIGNEEIGESRDNMERTELPASVQISGMGVFKDGKLKEWLGLEASRGAVWIQNKMRSTIMEVGCGDEPGGVAIELNQSRTGIRASFVRGRPEFRITIREEGNINELHCKLDLSDRDTLVALQKEWAKETEKEVRLAIDKAVTERTDIFGFGEELRRSDPRGWKKIEDRWPEMIADSRFEIEVDAYLRRTGMRIRTFLEE